MRFDGVRDCTSVSLFYITCVACPGENDVSNNFVMNVSTLKIPLLTASNTVEQK